MTEQPKSAPAGSKLINVFQQHAVEPVVHLLRVGATPQRLAWSLAVGIAVGVNPLLGSTTVACLAVAFILRLNLVASQIANHIVYPLQLALFFVFIGAGDRIFRTGGLPLGKEAMLHDLRHHPIATTRLLWRWEWHALTIWLAACCLLVPTLVMLFRPMLERLLARLQHHPTPTC